MRKAFDVVVIGGGPGGYVAAIQGAKLGMKIAVVERAKLGGTCLNWGCIPTKSLLKGAEQMRFLREAKHWGFTLSRAEADFPAIVERSRTLAETNVKGIYHLMKKNQIEVIEGHGRLVDKRTISVNASSGKEIGQVTGDHIIVATGGSPRIPANIRTDGKRIITSREALVLKAIPKSLIIIGGGAIGTEFGFIYHSFGSDVTIIEMMPRILPSEDEEISEALGRIYKKRGITIHEECTVSSANVTKNDVSVKVSGRKGSHGLRADICLVAAGIKPNIDNLGIEHIGVETTSGCIVVDEFMRTSVPGIYAIGDVVGPPYLAHVASHEGMVCIKKIAGSDIRGVDYQSIPSCTFCNPQVASIGLTEKEARADGREVKVGKFPFKASGKARIIGDTEGFVKMIFDARFGELLGAHILGPDATEMIAACGLAKTFEATLSEMASAVHAHPTLSEAVMEATWSALGQAIHV